MRLNLQSQQSVQIVDGDREKSLETKFIFSRYTTLEIKQSIKKIKKTTS